MSVIIDFHTHIWRYAERVSNSVAESSSPDSLIGDMDEAGVDKAVMAPIAYCESPPIPILLDNEYLVSAVNKYPGRLHGLVEIDPRNPNAVEIARRNLGEGLSVLKLMPSRHSFFMSNHRLLDPLFSVCAEARVPIFVLALDDINSTPSQIEEMARTFPEIPAVVIGQMGRKWLFGEACLVAKRTDNVYLETSDASLEVLDDSLSGAGARKVLYASHWPPNDMKGQLGRHRKVISDAGELSQVLGENAVRILDSRK